MTSTPTRPVDNVVITTKSLQDRNINILAGTTVENKGKFIITINNQNNLKIVLLAFKSNCYEAGIEFLAPLLLTR